MLNERRYMRWFGHPAPDNYQPGDQCGPGFTAGDMLRLSWLKHAIESGAYADDMIDAVSLRRLQFARWLLDHGIINEAGASA